MIKVFVLDVLNMGFNTVNGKSCCNFAGREAAIQFMVDSFNTVNGKSCCNLAMQSHSQAFLCLFQYRKR